MAKQEVCGGTSPWYGSERAINAALDLHRRGVDVTGLSEAELLQQQHALYENGNNTSVQSQTHGSTTEKR